MLVGKKKQEQKYKQKGGTLGTKTKNRGRNNTEELVGQEKERKKMGQERKKEERTGTMVLLKKGTHTRGKKRKE